MQVDPKEAARRLRAWNEYGEGADSGTPNEPGYTHDSLDFQRDLRALLSERDAATARAEAAEARCDLFDTQAAAAKVMAANAEAQRDAARAEAALLSAIENRCWDVRCVDVPTGGGDSDVAWVVIEHHMAPPRERQVGYGNSPAAAIRAALAGEAGRG